MKHLISEKGLRKMMYSFGVEKEDMRILEEIGLNIEQILKEANIPYRVFNDSKFTLSEQQYLDILSVIDRHVDIDSILLFNDVENRTIFDPAIFAGLCGENGYRCIKRLSKYNKLKGPIVFDLVETEEELIIHIQFKDGKDLPAFALLSQHVTLTSILRKGTGRSEIRPSKLCSAFDYSPKIDTYFGTKSEKKQFNKIVFNKNDLAIPFITNNNNMWSYLEIELNKRIEELQMDESYSAKVRKVLFEIIPSGISDTEYISKELGVSRRTLQRKLKEEGTTYIEQLNHTREMLVRNYLKMDMTLDEIAFLVNYSDAKSLSRAFQVWSGMSVTAYRKQFIDM